jgi:hypothetical protein
MKTSKDICKTIQRINPDFGKCGVNFIIYSDRKKKAWVVDYHKDGHHLKTFIDHQDVDDCINGDKCISFGLQIRELIYNFDKYIHEHALQQ